MSLLTLCQDGADLLGLPRPSAVVAASDNTTRRMLALANVEGQTLAKRTRWQALIKEATHTTLAATDQGAIETLAPGFSWLIGRTMWNRANQDRIGGPLSPAEWQARQAAPATGPYAEFRIRAGRLLMDPAPSVGQTIAFEYGSRHWCQSSGGADEEAWAADSDVGVLPEALMKLGLVWRFKQASGLDYAEAFRHYEIEVADAIAKDGGGRPSLHLDGGRTRWPARVRAPDGGWPL